MSDVEREGDGNALGDEMGGVPYPSDLTMPDPREGDRRGDFEGETDPRVQGDAADDGSPSTATDEDSPL